MRDFAYISCPYSHRDKTIKALRIKYFCDFAGKIEKEGKYHAISALHNLLLINNGVVLPDDYTFWESYSVSGIKISKLMYVLELPEWELSTGVIDEIKAAEEFKIPIKRIKPSRYWIKVLTKED